MARFLIWTAPLLIAAAPAVAQQASTDIKVADTKVASAEAAPAKPKKVCRTFEVTGRRIAQTECHTAAQWAEYDRVNGETANQFLVGVTHTGANKSDFYSGGNGAINTMSLFGLAPPQ